jgi:hypothetical protein
MCKGGIRSVCAAADDFARYAPDVFKKGRQGLKTCAASKEDFGQRRSPSAGLGCDRPQACDFFHDGRQFRHPVLLQVL